MIDDSSNTALDATTVSSKHFRWLASGAWGDEEIIFFSKLRGLDSRQIFKAPNFFRKLHTPHLDTVARWTLNRSEVETDLLGWAELQQIESNFNLGILLTHIEPTEHADEALALCLGACLILGEFDQLRLVSSSSFSAEILSWGEKKTIYTLTADATFLNEGKDNLAPIASIDIFPGEWWESEIGKSTQRELNYLRLRKKRFKNNCRCRGR